MAKHELNERTRRLFDLLRQLEEQQVRVSNRELEDKVVATTGYKRKTWSTYRSKLLAGILLFPDDEDPVLLRVRNALTMSESQFALALTQTKTSGLTERTSEEEWRVAFRRLAMFGRDRSFVLADHDRGLVLGLFGKQRQLPL